MRKTDTLQDNRDIIAELKQKDSHFASIFDEHTALDQQINQLDKDMVTHASRDDEIEKMKRRKLYLKDEIYKIIDKNKLQSQA
ncbi:MULTISPECIES: YdcH family protein [unclassified Psychrobacter]|uniref:YdcH family protein n=2 Tax=Psychrobacter TaxID=497 RepID=UPI003F488900